MISFNFRPRRVFQDSKEHGVTIPVEYHYRLREEGSLSKMDKPGAETQVSIVAPDGRTYEGVIYYGEAGGRFYYQIQCRGGEALTLCNQLKTEESIFVVVAMIHRELRVFFLDAQQQEHYNKFAAFKGPDAERRLIEELEKIAQPRRRSQ